MSDDIADRPVPRTSGRDGDDRAQQLTEPAAAARDTAPPPVVVRDIPGLTSLRAFAALLVFVYHLGAGMSVGLFAGGYTGVAFFFVLSGFV